MKVSSLFLAALAVFACAFAVDANAQAHRTLHVSCANGDNANTGSANLPFKTISAAARLAQPGDTVLVHAGVYREQVDPPRGGTSDAVRITYTAAPGEKATITGSDPARGWTKVSGDVWKLAIPNNKFGNFNPYVDTIRGDWFTPNGRVHHTGCVYLNGEWMKEVTNLDQVMQPVAVLPARYSVSVSPSGEKEGDGPLLLWFATVDGDTGEYLLNLASLKPSAGPRLAGGEPSYRYGTKPAPCSEGGTCTGWVRNGDWIRFDNVDFGVGSDRVELRASAQEGLGGSVELRLDHPGGELLGTCEVTSTGTWTNWKTFTAKIKSLSGKRSLCLVFKSPGIDTGKTTIYAQFPGTDLN
jgi:hypothetical protein